VPATSPYPEPQRPILYPHIQLPEDRRSYYPTIYAWVFQVVSLPQVSPPKPCIRLSGTQTCYMSHPSHYSQFEHPNNIGWGVQVVYHHSSLKIWYNFVPTTMSLKVLLL
jgi:hypothetical protein